MNKLCIHHDASGEIIAYGNTATPRTDCAVVEITVPNGEHIIPDAKKQKIDVEYGALIDKTPAEQAAALLPTVPEIRAAIFQELNYSDPFMLPHRPMPAEQRAEWPTYMKALRDLSKLPSPVEQVKAWPLRPDGSDGIPHLRARVT